MAALASSSASSAEPAIEAQGVLSGVARAARASVGAGAPAADGGARRAVRLPLRFDSVEHEVNVLSVRALLDLGRGYRALVAQHNLGRTFEDTALFGVMHMHISGKTPDAPFLSRANPFVLSQHYDLRGVTAEEEVMGGVFKEVDGPLMPYCKLLCTAAAETGKRLVALGSPSLGAWVLSRLQANAAGADAEAGALPALVADLAACFPTTFGDGLTNRKAVLLAESVADALRDHEPGRALGLGSSQAAAQASLPPSLDSDLLSALHLAGLLRPDAAQLFCGERVLHVGEAGPAQDVETELELRKEGYALMRDLLAAAGPGLSMAALEAYLRATYLADSASPRLVVQGTLHY